MKFYDAIDAFIADRRQQGRINSPHTELAYRSRLAHLGEVVGNRDPRLVGREDLKTAQRARIAGNVTPHTLRHGFGDHIAKYAGLRAAQALMGHASVETTATVYVDRPTLDEIAVSVQGFSFRRVLSLPEHPEVPHS